jgi:hypothetical protein
MAAMALCPSGVVDVRTPQTLPIVGTGDVVLAAPSTGLITLGTRGRRLGLVTTFTAIPEIEIQKGALDAIPFSVLSLPIRTTGTPVPVLPRARTRSLLLLSFLLRLFVAVPHHTLQHAQLRLYQS